MTGLMQDLFIINCELSGLICCLLWHWKDFETPDLSAVLLSRASEPHNSVFR